MARCRCVRQNSLNKGRVGGMWARDRHPVSNVTVARCLAEMGYTLQANVKTREGPQSFKVDVVAAAPLAGVERSVGEIAAPVQAATLRDLDQSGALDLSDFANRRLEGVHVNEIQGNPHQSD